MIRLVNFKREHLYEIEFAEEYLSTDSFTHDRDTDANALSQLLDCWTLLDDDKPACVMAVFPHYNSGVGEAAVFVSENCKANLIAICREIRSVTAVLLNTKYHRLQAHVCKDYLQGVKFVKLFGFEYEGTVKQWSSTRRDYEIYARVRNEH